MSALTEEQRTQASLKFLLLDQDSDGFIKTEEIGPFLRAVGLYPTPSEVTGYLSLVDPDGTGQVAREDAMALVEKLYPHRTQPEELHAALKMLDEDADGYVSTAQLRQILVSVGQRLTAEEAEEIIQDVEKDADGLISLDDLVCMLMPSNDGEDIWA